MSRYRGMDDRDSSSRNRTPPEERHHSLGRKYDGRGSGNRSSTEAESSAGSRNSNSGFIRREGRQGKYDRSGHDTERRRSTSPDSHRNNWDRDDNHRSFRSSSNRNFDSGRHDRPDRRSPNYSPERRRDRRSRERGRSRSRSQERHRSRSRERERRRPRSRSKERRRSRSKERRFRRSRSRERPRHRSHSHSRSRSPPNYSRVSRLTLANFKPASKMESSTEDTEQDKKSLDLNKEKPSKLPLNDLSQFTRSGLMTPQIAVQQAMAAMNARAQQMTGVSLPKYYNPAAINPLKYAEQMQKRKLLWQNSTKKDTVAPSTNNWETTTFAQDQDGKMAAKFKKLMGIKNDAEEKGVVGNDDQLRKQEELFRTLDHQYEAARMSTHSFRGVGLGFSSAAAAASVASTQILFPK